MSSENLAVDNLAESIGKKGRTALIVALLVFMAGDDVLEFMQPAVDPIQLQGSLDYSANVVYCPENAQGVCFSARLMRKMEPEKFIPQCRAESEIDGLDILIDCPVE